MQVFAHTWQPSSGSKYRPNATDSQSALAVEGVDERSGGRRGSAGSRGSRQPAPEQAPERTSHKKVFLARSLSSTLTALQIAAGAAGTAEDPVPTEQSPDRETSLASASLDDLLSGLLSAA